MSPDLFTPSLPYNGGSGSSGSDTSRAREKSRDSNGQTKEIQGLVLGWILWSEARGMTWREIQNEIGSHHHHGIISGALSNLHKTGLIARLSEIRDGSKVYVMPQHVDGRPIEAQGRPVKACKHCGGAL